VAPPAGRVSRAQLLSTRFSTYQLGSSSLINRHASCPTFSISNLYRWQVFLANIFLCTFGCVYFGSCFCGCYLAVLQ